MITLNIARLPIGIDNKFEHIAELAKDYITDASPVFTVSVSREDIEKEKFSTNHVDKKKDDRFSTVFLFTIHKSCGKITGRN